MSVVGAKVILYKSFGERGAGGIIRGWGLRGQGAKIFFLPGGGGAGGIIRGWR